MRPLTEAAILDRYDAATMTQLEIYPGVWDRLEEDASHRAFIAGAFTDLKDFVAAAASQALIVYIT